MIRRKQMFARPGPADWKPDVDEPVVVAAKPGTLSMQKAAGTIAHRQLIGFYLVRINYQRWSKVYRFHVEEMRPLPAAEFRKGRHV